jgi:hypothetical protein
MTDPRPLLVRIIAAIEAADEAQRHLLMLLDEARDAATRALGITARLSKELPNGLDAPGVVKLPRSIMPRSVPIADPELLDEGAAE